MNYLYVQTRREHPTVYLGTAENYSDAEMKARQFDQLHEFTLHIFPIVVSSKQRHTGLAAVELCKEGFVQFSDSVDYHLNCAGSELDRLPKEQQASKLQSAIDWLQRRLTQTTTGL